VNGWARLLELAILVVLSWVVAICAVVGALVITAHLLAN
jgi:hypothetical protein